jgi:hypothetical protein
MVNTPLGSTGFAFQSRAAAALWPRFGRPVCRFGWNAFSGRLGS